MDEKIEFIKHCGCPSKCFCKYDEQKLKGIWRKKFIQKVSTMELL
tara:strand:+ start:1153 stop:1287 length:135 start_codon:yes stop_codon:yes gene_type:complete